MKFGIAGLIALVCACLVGCASIHKVTVPAVGGLDIERAFAALRHAGLRVTVAKPFRVGWSALPKVRAEAPAVGTSVPRGTIVRLLLARTAAPTIFSSPSQPVRVPEVTSRRLGEAVARLRAAGIRNWWVETPLVLRSATSQHLFDAFRVYAQLPAPGRVLIQQGCRGSQCWAKGVRLRVRPTKSFPE